MSLKIIFMGTPKFSLKTLELIHKSDYKIISVYSQPAKKKSRGLKVVSSPVQNLAQKLGLIIRTPDKLDKEYNYFKKVKPDVVVVVAYGKILPKNIISIPGILFLNVHASLLPKFRGASPIARAILNLERETGISIMKIVEKLDAGPYMRQVKVPITSNMTSGDLETKLSDLGAQTLLECLKTIENKDHKFIEQNEKDISFAPKIKKEETRINWKQDSKKVLAQINAFNPNPGAWFNYKNKRIKIREAIEENKNGYPGEVLDDNLTIACSNRSVKILKIQKEGKSIINTKDFLLGNKIDKGEKLS
jgi:methionyl-tRNA formyltransferase